VPAIAFSTRGYANGTSEATRSANLLIIEGFCFDLLLNLPDFVAPTA